MKCLECAGCGREESAVGVCGSCGAAACAHHARVRHHPGRPASTGSRGRAARRELLCGVCAPSADPVLRRADDPAETALTTCAAGSGRHEATGAWR